MMTLTSRYTAEGGARRGLSGWMMAGAMTDAMQGKFRAMVGLNLTIPMKEARDVRSEEERVDHQGERDAS